MPMLNGQDGPANGSNPSDSGRQKIVVVGLGMVAISLM